MRWCACMFVVILLILGAGAQSFKRVGAESTTLTVPDDLSNIQAAKARESQQPDYWPTAGWRKSSPEMQGMSSAKLNEMMQYVRQQTIGIDSVVVVRNGYVVMEEYPRPLLYGPQNPHPLYSVTKSFSSALIGIALTEGFIDDVQHKVLDFFPNKTFANMGSLKEAITLEHLLTMTSGLPWDEWTYPYGDPRNDATQMMLSSDPVQLVLDRPMVSIPGTTWVYNGGGSHLLSAIVNETTGSDTEAFAREHLFNPLGISNLFWGRDPFQHLPWGFMGLSLTPLDMAKFGYLYLNNGTWNGQQIIPTDWVTASTRSHFSAWPGWRYGYQWWIGPASNVYVARGYMGQNIIVAPDYNMVVVFTGNYLYGPEGVQLFYNYILPAVGSTVPDDYPTIQEAIDHADVGDIILVRPGTYYEHVLVNKTISLVGEDVSTTIIDGNNTGHVVNIVSDNVNITGFTVQNSGSIHSPELDAGICLNGTAGCAISTNRLVGNGFAGISLLNSNQNTITCNNLSGIGWGGVHLMNSTRNLVSANAIADKYGGINGHVSSNYNNITENVISNCTHGMFYHASSYNNICGNNISAIAEEGIWLQDQVNYNLVAENNLINNTVAVRLEGPNYNNTLSRNVIAGAEYGVKIQNSARYTRIIDNIIVDNQAGSDSWSAGIRLDSGPDSQIHSNTITGNNYAVLLYSSSPRVSIFNNTIASNEFGVRVASGGSGYLNVSDNVVMKNRGYGIGLTGFGVGSNNATITRNLIVNNSDGIALGQYSNYNTISENNISMNDCGLYIEYSTKNMIYSNNIADNNRQVNVTSPSTNSWDNGYPPGGNYWSDYGGLDTYKGSYQNETGSDGIGDTPVVLDGNNTDRYPLITPWTEESGPIGDVNVDGKVDMKDVGYVARRFMCVPGDALWNPAADFNNDEKIDMVDIGTVARHYGESRP